MFRLAKIISLFWSWLTNMNSANESLVDVRTNIRHQTWMVGPFQEIIFSICMFMKKKVLEERKSNWIRKETRKIKSAHQSRITAIKREECQQVTLKNAVQQGRVSFFGYKVAFQQIWNEQYLCLGWRPVSDSL